MELQCMASLVNLREIECKAERHRCGSTLSLLGWAHRRLIFHGRSQFGYCMVQQCKNSFQFADRFQRNGGIIPAGENIDWRRR